jgi:hypothetical protein
MGRSSKQYDISGVPRCSAVKSEYVVRLYVFGLNRALDSPSGLQGKVMVLFVRAK